MRVIAEYIDNALYIDLVLSHKEINCVRDGEMVHAVGIEDGERIYIGLRVDDGIDPEESFWWDEDDS